MRSAREYIKKISDNLEGKDLLKNPFKGYARFKEEGKELYLLLVMTAIYPTTYLMAVLVSLPVLFFNGFTLTLWWLFPIILLSFNFFHSGVFYYLVFSLGSRKNGYMGDIKFTNKEDVIRRFV